MHGAKAEKDKNAKNLLADLSINTKRQHLENAGFVSVFYSRYSKLRGVLFCLVAGFGFSNLWEVCMLTASNTGTTSSQFIRCVSGVKLLWEN